MNVQRYSVVCLQEYRSFWMPTKDKAEQSLVCRFMNLRVLRIRSWSHKCIPFLDVSRRSGREA